MCIRTRYIVFGDNFSANMIKNVRDRGKCGATDINPLPMYKLSTYKHLCKLSRDFGSSTWTGRPLFLLGVVWVSKFELVVRASRLQPSQQWFEFTKTLLIVTDRHCFAKCFNFGTHHDFALQKWTYGQVCVGRRRHQFISRPPAPTRAVAMVPKSSREFAPR